MSHHPVSLELRDLSKSFDSQMVLDKVSLRIPSGALLAVLGPSGCGKSTLLRIVAGLEKANSGTVFFDEKDVTEIPAHRRPCHTVFQSYALFPHLSVSENVAFGPRIAGLRGVELQQRVEEAMGLARITPLASRKPTQLSGGQQQRVALARAMVNRPALLLLDEPFSALDRELREELQEELREIRRKVPTTVLFVTHDHDEAFGLSTYVAVIDHGRILQFGPPEELYRFPATARVAELLGIPNVLIGEVITDHIQGDALMVMTSLGALSTGNSEPGLRKGQRVKVFVRPGSIIAAGGEGSAGEGFNASIVERSFRGDHYRYLVRAGGELLRVEQSSAERASGISEGSATRFVCEPRGIFVYRASV
jgi:ABC-type Fe3+/spermidine/putrescine transport system ATPase subunit